MSKILLDTDIRKALRRKQGGFLINPYRMIPPPPPAYPTVLWSASATADVAAGGSSTPFPAVVAAGALIIAVVGTSSGWPPAVGGAGWTLLHSATGTSVAVNVYYKVASGTEGGTNLVFSLSGYSGYVSLQAFLVKENTYAVGGIEYSTLYSGEVLWTVPNAPACSPTWGLAATLWIRITLICRLPTLYITGYPDSDNNISSYFGTSSGGSICMIGGCTGNASLATKPAASWALDTGAYRWQADTIAIRPA